MKLSLVVLAAGKMEGKALEIKLSQFVIGRDPQCHLRPASPLISKRHCAVIQREGKAFIRDFGSTNGTFINDQPVKGEAELHHDDRLKVGPLLFAVRMEAGTASGSTPPPATRPAAAPVAPSAKAPTPRPATAAAPAKKEAPEPAAPAEPAKKEAPAPAAAAKSGEDDDIAAMLLSLQDDDSSAGAGLSGSEVPDGSTVMDLVVPPGGSPDAAKPDKDKPKPHVGNTSNAAKSILEKYMRRPRNQ